MAFPLSAARGVTNVIEKCDAAKTTGFLDLSSCSLLFIADAIYLVLKGYSVDKVSIRNNSIKKFPKKMIEKFPNVAIFNMEWNQISEIPEELQNWKDMKGMNLANNKLTSLPEGIFSMNKLAILDISGNEIKDFDVERFYTSCPMIIQLIIKDTPLSAETLYQLNNSDKKPSKIVIKSS